MWVHRKEVYATETDASKKITTAVLHSSTFSVCLHSDEILDSAPEHGIQRNGIKAQEPAM